MPISDLDPGVTGTPQCAQSILTLPADDPLLLTGGISVAGPTVKLDHRQSLNREVVEVKRNPTHSLHINEDYEVPSIQSFDVCIGPPSLKLA